ncbi:MAG TPA: alpha/beta family hydrolase [Roseiarcus sp.]|nr:alpha/beta family hydrolase [Roseiarcus sp.]
MNASETSSPFQRPGIRGFLHRPAQPSGEGLVLAHGAGANCNAPVLLAAAGAFQAAGVTVLRCDLPFRQKRSSGPPHPSGAAEDREGLRLAAAALREIAAGAVYLGGHSYGGRQASILAAERPDAAEALLLLSYPLHPPNKPEQLRTAHFPNLRAPATFVHGAADPFGSIAEMEQAIASIPAQARLIVADGAGHDLKRGRLDFAPIVAAVQASVRP